MRLTIRWKLILLLTIPLVLTYATMLTVDYIRIREGVIEQTQSLVVERSQNLAWNLNGKLQAAMQLAESTAFSLSRSAGLNEAQLRAVLDASLRQNQWVSSAIVVFTPVRGMGDDPPRTMVSIVRRGGPGSGRPGGENLTEIDFTQFPFYTQVQADERAQWLPPRAERGFGPRGDRGPGPREVCTYSAPILSRDGFRGVVAVNVAVDDLQQVRPRPRGRGFGGRGQRGMGPPTQPEPATLPAEVAAIGADAAAIIAPDGRILSPPPPPPEVNRPSLLAWAEQHNITELPAEFRAALAGESGLVRVPGMGDMVRGFKAGENYWLALAPIPATGWVFAAAIPESQAIAPVMQRLWQRAGFLLFGLLLLVLIVFIVSIRISRPIEHMAAAVEQLASGNLDARVTEVRSRDELGQLARAFNSMTQQLKTHVAALTEQSAAREKVEAEMRIARQIQTDLLPRTFPPFPDRTEFDLHAMNVPARRVAGDFYDFFFNSEGLLTIVIGDVSGKGMPAALLMAVTRTIIRNLAMEGRSPRQIVDRTNTLLLNDITNSMFVTLFLCQYDPMAGRITYVNAGHPRPYRFGTNGGPRPFGEITGALVGVSPVEEIGAFNEGEDQLEAGETLLLYTDGVTEARSPDGRMLRDAGMQSLLARHRAEGVDRICQRLVEEVNLFQENQPVDDITLVALRRRLA
jgi:sigma-B regulation protein RsbU (phosphoserine phosphatase)